jgi:hypothetical protein
MGLIGKYIYRTALASLALIPVSLAGAPGIARNARRLRLLGRPVTA